MKYVKKPIVIDAVCWEDDEKSYLGLIELGAKPYITVCSDGTLVIKTLEGIMNCNLGSYVIKGVQGEFYPCKAEIFEQTYERVE